MAELVVRYVKFAIAFALVWVLLYFWTSCSLREIKGKEMGPAGVSGDNYWILIKERTPDQLNLGDIIAFEYAHPGQSQDVARAGRVQGLPGQRVKIVKGDLYINDRKTGNAVGKPEESFEEVIVPRDCLFILMDHREVGPTMDSRSIGPLGAGTVIGRIKK